MRKKWMAFLLFLCILFGVSSRAAAADAALTEAQVYESMIAMKAQYPEGMRWTNANSYRWKGGIYSTGYGCAGFAFLLSDAAFGDLPARLVKPVSFKDVRAGDILRINGDTHSVIILEVKTDGIVIAEGNYNSSVHWGRTLSAAQVEASDYMLTRYPEGGGSGDQPQNPQKPGEGQRFWDVGSEDWFYTPVEDMCSRGIMSGLNETTFGPGQNLTRAQFAVILHRAAKTPAPLGGKDFADVKKTRQTEWYYDAVRWASSEGVDLIRGYDDTGMFGPNDIVTREQIAAMLYRYAGYKRYSRAAVSDLREFADANQVTPYAQDAMRWIAGSGIIQGNKHAGAKNTLDPGSNTSRAECAAIIMRFLEKYER